MTIGVLVTGATTGYGVRLVEKLLKNPAIGRVVAVARPGEACPIAHDGDGLHFVNADLLRSRDLRDVLWGPGRGCQAVVHAAMHRSPTAVGSRAHRLNVDGTRTLLAMSEEHPTIERFVFRGSADVYRVGGRLPAIIDEMHPLELSPQAPQWIRDRVEADLMVCTYAGLSPVKTLVMRFAPCLAPRMGSQLYDYLQAPVCLRPIGFDPTLNVISLEDMVRATIRAVLVGAEGIVNVPGRDTLSLSCAIHRWGRAAVPLPAPLLGPAYDLRARLSGSDFRYHLNARRFHYNGVLSGVRAKGLLGYEPAIGVDWPVGGRLPPPPHPLRAVEAREVG